MIVAKGGVDLAKSQAGYPAPNSKYWGKAKPKTGAAPLAASGARRAHAEMRHIDRNSSKEDEVNNNEHGRMLWCSGMQITAYMYNAEMRRETSFHFVRMPRSPPGLNLGLPSAFRQKHGKHSRLCRTRCVALKLGAHLLYHALHM